MSPTSEEWQDGVRFLKDNILERKPMQCRNPSRRSYGKTTSLLTLH
jgi:hypothetical protein